MKRFFIIASMAILAIGCQKTEIQNEVKNQIGFSTETGKLTRAIVQPVNGVNTYYADQPFAVYAYSYQNQTTTGEDGTSITNKLYPTTVMDHVEISYNNGAWSATTGTDFTTKYYWPNDPRTEINFYAFSPYIQRLDDETTEDVDETSIPATKAGVAGKEMVVTAISHDETNGLTFEGYVHNNMYVDFMEANPVVGATFSDPDGNADGTNVTYGNVPMTFNHKMTQVVFKVVTNSVYPGVKFTVEEITLKNIKNTASYNGKAEDPWTESGAGTYYIFPANMTNGTTLANNATDTNTNLEAPVVKEYPANAANETSTVVMETTTPVTMIPQTMSHAGNVTPNAGKDSYAAQTAAQMFMITYTVEGKGVAKETVTKHVPFKANANDPTVDWGVNKKITYTVSIGLNEITFTPSVAAWDDTDEKNTPTDDTDDTPWGDDYNITEQIPAQ